jgi:UDP-glucoronosyl and UDP-glucosyl transferase
MTISQSAFGFDYARPLPPLVQLVGPLLLPTPAADGLDSDALLFDWLDERADNFVVYCAFGTGGLDLRLFGRWLSDAFALLTSAERCFDVLWALGDDVAMAPADMEALARRSSASLCSIRFERGVSQLDVLAHRAVKLMVTHGGVNSVLESLYFGTPLVVAPISTDQPDNAQRVADCGAGIRVDTLLDAVSGAGNTLDADELVRAILRVYARRSRYSAAARRVGALLRDAGGVERAAQLVLSASRVGTDHLTFEPPASLIVTYSLDLLLVASLLAIVALGLLAVFIFASARATAVLFSVVRRRPFQAGKVKDE